MRKLVVFLIVAAVTYTGIKVIRAGYPNFLKLPSSTLQVGTELEEYAKSVARNTRVPAEVVPGVLRLDSIEADPYSQVEANYTCLKPGVDLSEEGDFMSTFRKDLWTQYTDPRFKKFRDREVTMIWRVHIPDRNLSMQLVARPGGITSF